MGYLTQRWPLRAGRRGWIIAALVCLALLGVLVLIDEQLSIFGQGLPPPIIQLFGWITLLGLSDWILIPALILLVLSAALAALIPKPIPKQALWQMTGIWAFVFLGIGIPGLITAIIKRVIGRSRPVLFDTVGTLDFRTWSWVDWTYQSFPSGHTTTAFAACFTFSFLAPRSYPLMLILAGLVALSRIVLGAHYATDVLGGAIVGTLGAYLVRNIFAWRGWAFAYKDDGSVVMKPLTAVRQLIEERSEPKA